MSSLASSALSVSAPSVCASRAQGRGSMHAHDSAMGAGGVGGWGGGPVRSHKQNMSHIHTHSDSQGRRRGEWCRQDWTNGQRATATAAGADEDRCCADGAAGMWAQSGGGVSSCPPSLATSPLSAVGTLGSHETGGGEDVEWTVSCVARTPVYPSETSWLREISPEILPEMVMHDTP